jgi:hypothetical protein
MQLCPNAFRKRLSFVFFVILLSLHLHARFSLLMDLADTLTDLVHRDYTLRLLLILSLGRFMGNNYSAAVDTADNIKYVVIFFELFEWPRTFNERTFAVSQLAKFVVTPKEKSPVVKAS